MHATNPIRNLTQKNTSSIGTHACYKPHKKFKNLTLVLSIHMHATNPVRNLTQSYVYGYLQQIDSSHPKFATRSL